MRRAITLLLVAVALAVVLLSPRFGRAVTVHNYRPDLPPDSLASCWPLPDGLVLPFEHQVRSDRLVGPPGERRRELLVQFDRIDPDAARRRLEAAVRESGARVRFVVRPLPIPPTAAERYVVRGSVLLDLPPTQPSTEGDCASPYTTKDFPPGLVTAR